MLRRVDGRQMPLSQLMNKMYAQFPAFKEKLKGLSAAAWIKRQPARFRLSTKMNAEPTVALVDVSMKVRSDTISPKRHKDEAGTSPAGKEGVDQQCRPGSLDSQRAADYVADYEDDDCSDDGDARWQVRDDGDTPSGSFVPQTVSSGQTASSSGSGDPYHAAYWQGYVRGHEDAARDIYTNAEAAAHSLRAQLEDERVQELEAALAAVRGKRQRQRDEAARAAKALEQARRVLALRQYIEMRRVAVCGRAAKPWRLRVRRGAALLDDVLEAFAACGSAKKLFSPTAVTFTSELGQTEDGDDRGGLTAEMFTLVWAHALRPAAGLFESFVAPSGDALLVPAPLADVAALESVGKLLLKCVLDDQPIAGGLSRVVLDFLVFGHEAPSLTEVAPALDALADCDGDLADAWRVLVDDPSGLSELGITFDAFDGGAAPARADERVTPANVGEAVLHGCRARLLGARRTAFEALRRGFLGVEDLQVQLAAVGLEGLRGALQGRRSLSAEELLDCFELPRASEPEAHAAGFAAVGSPVDGYFEAVIRGEGGLGEFGEAERLALLQWCTALGALPAGGLEDKIRLRLYGPEPDDETLPETHTCTRELHLPNYSCPSVLREKLLLALSHGATGFYKK